MCSIIVPPAYAAPLPPASRFGLYFAGVTLRNDKPRILVCGRWNVLPELFPGRSTRRTERRRALRWLPAMGGLLERVGVADQSRLAERGARERHADGRVLRVEALRERRRWRKRRRRHRWIGHEPGRYDDARITRPRRDVGSSIGQEEHRVEVPIHDVQPARFGDV